MSAEFWVGIALSIPIGIGTSLSTPWFQRKLDERGNRKALAQTKNTKADLERVSFYKDHPDEFSQFLVYVVIRTTFTTALSGILSAFFFEIASLSYSLTRAFGIPAGLTPFLSLDNFASALGELALLVGSIMILNICRPALSIWIKVRNYEEYKTRMEAMLNA